MPDKTAERPFPAGGDTIPFDRVQDAVRYAARELEEGRAINLWPIRHEGYVVVARRGVLGPHALEESNPFAPTVPMELESLPERRRSVMARLLGNKS